MSKAHEQMKRLAEMQQDTKRLDWLQKHGEQNGYLFCVQMPTKTDDIRAAVDKAIAEQEGK